MDINDLPKILEQLQNRAGEQEALRSTMLEISTAMADLLQLLEKSGPSQAKAIADALKGLKLGEIKATVNVPQPLVQVLPAAAAAGWSFEHQYDGKGRVSRSIATPILK